MPTDWNLADSLGPASHLWLPPTNIVQAAGAYVRWPDASGSAVDIANIVTGPPTVGVLQNGLNGVTFDGITWRSLTVGGGLKPIVNDLNQFHAAAIVKPTGAGGADAANPGNNNGIIADSGGRWGLVYATLAGTDYFQAYYYSVIATRPFVQIAAPRGSVYFVEWWKNPLDLSINMRVNAGAVVTSTVGAAASDVGNEDRLCLGEGTGVYQACVIGEVFVASRMLGVNSQPRLRASISSRWRQAA